MKSTLIILASCWLLCSAAFAQVSQTKGSFVDKFRQLDEVLPTANNWRTASGAPGADYWQQRVDYSIKARLDEDKKRIIASEEITYHNNSPDTLNFLWVQLDQNRFSNSSMSRTTETAEVSLTGTDQLSFASLRREQAFETFDGGYKIVAVTQGNGRALATSINDTMMRVDLPTPLRPGQTVAFTIAWEHNIVQQAVIGGRGGYEHFEETDTYQFALAQWFPRLAAYTDYAGWANKQFLGRGEFTLEFGNYEVALTVPADHIVSATGELQNPNAVLSQTQRQRLQQARSADTPIFIVTPEEALSNQSEGTDDTSTWVFKADNVRDFAWASSRKYIWDAMVHHQDDSAVPEVLAMSFYPPEAEPLWSRYSTHAVAHTLDVYSRFSFAHPYPVAQSVNAWKSGGMEYPMISFNGNRPVKDKDTGEVTYTDRAKYGLISVVIHEIGHIYFPMTVNSDERQWTWMDEGLNTFLQFLSEREWEDNYPARRGDPANITEYMLAQDQVPIMTQSDSVLQFGNNAYAKPATALVVLRETVMGRELFDFAFQEYARRWMFKRPTPADFFRTLEDASAVDLDWFWRGWFYSTDHVDIAIADISEYRISSQDPELEFPQDREKQNAEPASLTQIRNGDIDTRLERFPGLNDFYNDNDPFTVTNADRNKYTELKASLEPWELAALDKAVADGALVYFIDFVNEGGLVMPLPLRLTYEDQTTEDLMLPAEIWRYNPQQVTKMLISKQRLIAVELDPLKQIADADTSDNRLPREIQRSRLEIFKTDEPQRNMMADMLIELKADESGQPDDNEAQAVPMEPVP